MPDSMTPGCPKPDPWAARAAVIFLGLVSFSTTIIIGKLASSGADIPPGLAGIGGTALGALAGMLPGVMSRR